MIFPGDKCPHGFSAGGKGNNLLKLAEFGLNVPRFSIISPDEPLDDKLINQLENYFGTNYLFAVRSSATVEDGLKHSFAGQFETKLNVPFSDLKSAITAVRKSGNSERVQAYANNTNLKIKLYVIIQEMLDPEVSGVGFGVNPVSGNAGESVIAAVYGLGEGLVSGTLNSDNYLIADGRIQRSIAEKPEKIIKHFSGTGTMLSEVPEHLRRASCLADDQCFEIDSLLKLLEKEFNGPQDIEWCYVNSKLFLLQTRPVTTINAAKLNERVVWDNSNIIESYPGTVSPLTFSFILEVYEVAYREFLNILGVDKQTIAAHKPQLSQMLGLIRGKVYYNLKSWYQLLSLLPGFKLNASFMETMMGVKERFELPPQKKSSKGIEYLRVAKVLLRIVKQYRGLPRETRRFQLLLQDKISYYSQLNYAELTSGQLIRSYLEFENSLLMQWKPPLANDLFAMIFFGFLKKKSAEWINSGNVNIHNDLLCGSSDIISTAPVKESLIISGKILENKKLKTLFVNSSSEEVITALKHPEYSEINDLIKKYINSYGYRCIGELKLESISYTDDPLLFIDLIRSYVKADFGKDRMDSKQDQGLRLEAEKEINLKLKGNPFRKRVFNYLLKNTRRLVSNRENLRFERTRAFGIVRLHFMHIGNRLFSDGVIDNSRDVYFIKKKEIINLCSGNFIPDLKLIISKRKKAYEIYEKELLPDRIEMFGDPDNWLPPDSFSGTENRSAILQGIGCCPGTVKDTVTIMRKHNDPVAPEGSIIVAMSTDPGWITVFPYARGIIAERGSLLSHTAIVAREMGIPCIVGVDNLMKSLDTGDTIIMDGSSGEIRIISRNGDNENR